MSMKSRGERDGPSMWLAHIGMKGRAYAVLLGKHESKSLLVKPRSRMENQIKVIMKAYIMGGRGQEYLD